MHLWGDHISIYREKKEVQNLPFDSVVTAFLARYAVKFLLDAHFYTYLILSALEVRTFEYTLGKFLARGHMPYNICDPNIYGRGNICSWKLQNGHMGSTGLLCSSDQYQLLQRKMHKSLQ